MGYVFDFNDVVAYERWVKDPRIRKTARLENRLMTDMLKPIRGETLLDIGCGTGANLAPFLDLGLQVTGMIAASASHNGMDGRDCRTSIIRWTTMSTHPP